MGDQARHSYYQLLSQGTHKIATDLISVKQLDGEMINSLCRAKINVLSKGIRSSDPHGYIPGGTPINHLQIENDSPFSIGALISLYEHKIFAQSVIWNINPFDQPGVESAKKYFSFNPSSL